MNNESASQKEDQSVSHNTDSGFKPKHKNSLTDLKFVLYYVMQNRKRERER